MLEQRHLSCGGMEVKAAPPLQSSSSSVPRRRKITTALNKTVNSPAVVLAPAIWSAYRGGKMLHRRVGPQRCLCQWLCKQTEWELLTKQRSCAEIPARGVKRLSARRGGALEIRSAHAHTHAHTQHPGCVQSWGRGGGKK